VHTQHWPTPTQQLSLIIASIEIGMLDIASFFTDKKGLSALITLIIVVNYGGSVNEKKRPTGIANWSPDVYKNRATATSRGHELN
jgi:hypothetical protein